MRPETAELAVYISLQTGLTQIQHRNIYKALIANWQTHVDNSSAISVCNNKTKRKHIPNHGCICRFVKDAMSSSANGWSAVTSKNVYMSRFQPPVNNLSYETLNIRRWEQRTATALIGPMRCRPTYTCNWLRCFITTSWSLMFRLQKCIATAGWAEICVMFDGHRPTLQTA